MNEPPSGNWTLSPPAPVAVLPPAPAPAPVAAAPPPPTPLEPEVAPESTTTFPPQEPPPSRMAQATLPRRDANSHRASDFIDPPEAVVEARPHLYTALPRSTRPASPLCGGDGEGWPWMPPRP